MNSASGYKRRGKNQDWQLLNAVCTMHMEWKVVKKYCSPKQGESSPQKMNDDNGRYKGKNLDKTGSDRLSSVNNSFQFS
jgi:hypothetical protein